MKSIIKTKKEIKKLMSAHNPVKIDRCRKVRNKKVEMFNLENKEGRERFTEPTSEKEILSWVFISDVDICTRKFLRVLDQCIRKSFKR